MLRRNFVVTLASLALVPAFASAETAKFTIDPVHSEVSFSIRHLVSKTSGRFGQFGGDITMDPKDPSTMVINGKIQTASINTNNEKRDGHLKSPDFFDVATHPEITFKSTKVAKSGDKWTLTGDLTMKGVTKPVTLDLAILGVSPSPVFGGVRVGIEATGKINRKDWGVNWNNAVEGGGTILGDDVDLTIRAEAVNAVEKADAMKPAKSEKEEKEEKEREAKEKAGK